MAGEDDKQTQGKCISLDYLCLRFAILGVLFITPLMIRWFNDGVDATDIYTAMAGVATGTLLSIYALAILIRSVKKGVFVIRSRLTSLQFLARFLLVVAIGGILFGVILNKIAQYYSLSDVKVVIVCLTWLVFTNGTYCFLFTFCVLWLQRYYGKKFYFQKKK